MSAECQINVEFVAFSFKQILEILIIYDLYLLIEFLSDDGGHQKEKLHL